jgi:hypothetical protein
MQPGYTVYAGFKEGEKSDPWMGVKVTNQCYLCRDPRLRFAHLDPDGGRGMCIRNAGVHEHMLHGFLTQKSTM